MHSNQIHKLSHRYNFLHCWLIRNKVIVSFSSMRPSSVLHYVSLFAVFTGCNKICSLKSGNAGNFEESKTVIFIAVVYCCCLINAEERSVQFCSLKFNCMHSQIVETMTFLCISHFLLFSRLYVCIRSQAFNHLTF